MRQGSERETDRQSHKNPLQIHMKLHSGINHARMMIYHILLQTQNVYSHYVKMLSSLSGDIIEHKLQIQVHYTLKHHFYLLLINTLKVKPAAFLISLKPHSFPQNGDISFGCSLIPTLQRHNLAVTSNQSLCLWFSWEELTISHSYSCFAMLKTGSKSP